MLNAPTRRLDLPLLFRHRFHCLLILIDDETIAEVANRMRLYLDAFAQGILKYWLESFFLDRKETGSVRLIRIGSQQRCAARTQRAVSIKFYRAHGQPIAVGANDWAIMEKSFSFRTGSGYSLINTKLDLSGSVKFLVQINFFITAAGIL